MKTALIVDVNSLYFETQKKFGNYRVNYEKYLEELRAEGLILTHMYAFSDQVPKYAAGFKTVLKSLGFQVRFGTTSWNVEMALQLARVIDQVECFVLGSSRDELGRLFVYAKERGIVCKCNSVNVPWFFKDNANVKELDISSLDFVRNYEADNSTQQMELCANVDSNGSGH